MIWWALAIVVGSLVTFACMTVGGLDDEAFRDRED